MKDHKFVTLSLLADILCVSKRVVSSWVENGKIVPEQDGRFLLDKLNEFKIIREMSSSKWDEQELITPNRVYRSIELFAGAGGMALGLHKSGFSHVMLNENNKNAADTLRCNMPDWNVETKDIREVSFSKYKDIDLLSGGFPCQPFSNAGKTMGFNDTRGTLFYELARAAQECKPKVLLLENVKGLLNHDKGKTLKVIKNTINSIGYKILQDKVLNSMFYKVPQKRERLILVCIRDDLFDKANFELPDVYNRVLTLKDAFSKGDLYNTDCPSSNSPKYSEKKEKVMSLVPQGGCWVDLPDNVKREYMGKSYFSGGGKTGVARRLSLENPSLTLTCSPSQKQTERCHPLETRPLTIREYSRIQTFPDEWVFSGSITSQYKQIGNSVPVNLANVIGLKIVKLLNEIES